MPASEIIQLRQLLAERFPGLRTRADERMVTARNRWFTGLPQLDEPLQGGLVKGALTEIVAERRGSGSDLLMTALIRKALRQRQFVAVIDGSDSLDVTQVGDDLTRLLWVRCRSANEALKAADLLFRDGNLPLLLLDLAGNPADQLRKISATTWYRLQRIIEPTSAAGVILTPRPMVSPACTRITLSSSWQLSALERGQDELLCELKMEIAENHRFSDERETLSGSA